MLYGLYDLQRQLLQPFSDAARVASQGATGFIGASLALLHRSTKQYERGGFGLGTEICEDVVAEHAFCRLLRFSRQGVADQAQGPRVLLCAPLSGHHPTLLRETIATLVRDHEVFVTDWRDARDVPVAHGVLSLEGYVAWIRGCIERLGPRGLHVFAVCQPAVPVLAAVALAAAAGEATPSTLTLMGGPIDARISPTEVGRFARARSRGWFEANMIHRVPARYLGRGRAVYPGFLQLAAFVMMNPSRHASAHRSYWFDRVRGDAEAVANHERFYDEYNAVLDLDAPYYLDTVESVFQDFTLARGAWRVDGELVCPARIASTALFTIEGATDDICGLGQTAAAHRLCTGIAADRHRHLVVDGCGHYGLFAGHRWRETIYPALREFIRMGSAS